MGSVLQVRDCVQTREATNLSTYRVNINSPLPCPFKLLSVPSWPLLCPPPASAIVIFAFTPDFCTLSYGHGHVCTLLAALRRPTATTSSWPVPAPLYRPRHHSPRITRSPLIPIPEDVSLPFCNSPVARAVSLLVSLRPLSLIPTLTATRSCETSYRQD